MSVRGKLVAGLIWATAVGCLDSQASIDRTFLAQDQGQLPALQVEPQGTLEQRKTEAETHLRSLYAFYLAMKGCTEASEELTKTEFRPSISLDDARRTMTAADAAAKEVGLDVDGIWAKAAPVGELSAASLKVDTPENLDKCRRSARLFRTILSRFQLAVSALGYRGSLIGKDF